MISPQISLDELSVSALLHGITEKQRKPAHAPGKPLAFQQLSELTLRRNKGTFYATRGNASWLGWLCGLFRPTL
jgi:hypothetical protein